MIRLFENHQVRKVKELEGMWDFCVPDSNKVYTLPVPGCWEQHPDFYSYRGHGTYRKTVCIEKDCNVRLEFKGVSHTADVYFDGEKVAHHYNAYTPFSAIIKNTAKGEHEIRVEVDNGFSEASALHVPNDYYSYGGLTRPVGLEILDDAYIKSVHFTPYLKDGVWYGKTEIVVCNLTENELSVYLCGELAEHIMADNITLGANSEKTVVFESSYADVSAWSNASPNLYMLKVTLSVGGKEIDDLIERVGFRTVEFKGKDILLNGEKVFLKGFNRHEDYASEGCAVSFGHMVQDINLMVDMGANALRTCHYPNDERMLDLCDERGIMVWEENHARGLSLKQMQNPNFERQCADCIDEMIENHYNHPSIVIWGILNECASQTDEGREMYKKQLEQIKSLDASRPHTFATCMHFTDKSLDLPDVLSLNIYCGWGEDVDTKERIDREVQWMLECAGEEKPVIISEFGAGAIYGFRDKTCQKWSEERQAEIIRDNLEVYMNKEEISGTFVWQFADCRVTPEVWVMARAACRNNKGVVDMYRRPKLSYDVIKEMFGKYKN